MNPRFNVQVPKLLRQDILNFTLNPDNETYFDINRSNDIWRTRRYCVTTNYPELNITQHIREFSKQAYLEIGVEDFIEEHLYGNFIGVNFNSGNVHEHRDPKNEKGFIHTRFNFLLQKPERGGNPVIDGIEYPMEEGQAWLNLASEWMHGSTPVEGDRARIVLSLGAYLHPGVVKYLIDVMHKTNV